MLAAPRVRVLGGITRQSEPAHRISVRLVKWSPENCMPPLGPEANRIFRITHIENVPYLLEHGIHCRSSRNLDPNFTSIGIAALIDRRSLRQVPIDPRGTLADYVPFYFTPYSMMLLNITTGRGVEKRAKSEIVILVSSLDKLREMGCKTVSTDGHASMQGTNFYSDPASLDRIDWDIIKHRDFEKSEDDVDKSRRYQAEALAHEHVPPNSLLGIACYDADASKSVTKQVKRCNLSLNVKTLPNFYY